jgi:hypothetical protein
MNETKNPSERKRLKKILIIFSVIIISVELIFIFLLKHYAKEDTLKETASNSLIKTDGNYVLYTGKAPVSFKDLNNSTIIYKNTITLKLINGKLKTVAEFGNSSITKNEKKDLLKTIKNIEKSAPVKNIKIEKEKRLAIISGGSYYITIAKKNKCFYYIVTNNDKTVFKYLKYCSKEK